MELEEAEDEEWDTRKYSYKHDAGSGCVVRWVLKRGVCVGKKILVAGFIASAAPVVVPPLVVASAIGLAVCMPCVCMPCAVFLGSHICAQNLMSKLLPMPTLQDPPLRKEMCFQQGSDDMHIYREEQAPVDETKRDIEMDGFQCMKNGEIMTLGSECGSREEDATDGIEVHSSGENNGVPVQPISGDNEEFKTPFGVTDVVLEESLDRAMEGDIEEAELQRETKGLLEKIRDEGRTDMTQERGEYVEGICGRANESGQKIGRVEDMEETWEDTPSTIGGTGEDLRKEEDLNVREEMLHSRNDESEDTMSEGKEFDTINYSKKSADEPSELMIPAEPIEDLPIEGLVYNIPMDEDSSEVIGENFDIHRGKLDYNISDSENQESHMHELNERTYLEDAEAREIANESALDLFDGKRIDPDENAYTIDLREESSNIDRRTDSTDVLLAESSNIDRRTDSMDVLVSSVEQESWPSECSSEENIICPSEEVVLDDEKMWKEINVIRKIVGYEGRKEASCADELKALYIFTGVEPPTSLDENSMDPLEIREKIQFLMSILGIKSNMT